MSAEATAAAKPPFWGWRNRGSTNMVLAGLVAELREHGKRPVDLFNACDTDRDGLISAEDFTAGLRLSSTSTIQRRLSTASLMAVALLSHS